MFRRHPACLAAHRRRNYRSGVDWIYNPFHSIARKLNNRLVTLKTLRELGGDTGLGDCRAQRVILLHASTQDTRTEMNPRQQQQQHTVLLLILQHHSSQAHDPGWETHRQVNPAVGKGRPCVWLPALTVKPGLNGPRGRLGPEARGHNRSRSLGREGGETGWKGDVMIRREGESYITHVRIQAQADRAPRLVTQFK